MQYKNLSNKKTNNFVITLSLVIIIVQLLFFSIYEINVYLISLLFILNILNILKKNTIRFLAHYLNIFGTIIGKFTSPILLSIIYIISILSVNLIFRLFGFDTLNRKVSLKTKSYWMKSEKKIKFKDQF